MSAEPLTIPRGRRLRLIPPGEPVRCINHHKPSDLTLLDDGHHALLHCTTQYRRRRDCPPVACNTDLYVVAMKGGWKLVCEVTDAEIRHMQQQHHDWAQALRFLGVTGVLTVTGE